MEEVQKGEIPMYSPSVSTFWVARTLTENKSKRRADMLKSLWEDKESGCNIPKIRRIQNQEVVNTEETVLRVVPQSTLQRNLQGGEWGVWRYLGMRRMGQR